jgi:hypothetical protein
VSSSSDLGAVIDGGEKPNDPPDKPTGFYAWGWASGDSEKAKNHQTGKLMGFV